MGNKIFLLLLLLVGTACAGNQPTTRAAGYRWGPAEDRATTPAAIAVSEWWTGAKPCPDGALLKGALPPLGNAVWCEQGGQVHGTRTSFHMNGERWRSERFYRGRLDGHFAVWHQNGVVAEEG